MEKDNDLIAEFMGYVNTTPTDKDFNIYEHPETKRMIETMSMKYHTSWDWLMPVVEKIEMLGYTFEKNYQKIDGDWQSLIVKGNDILFQEFNRDSKLSTCYVVVEFIQWYKNQN